MDDSSRISQPMTGTEYWTPEGELEPSKSTEGVARTFLGKEQSEHLAVRILSENEPKPSIFTRTFKFTKLKLGGETSEVRVNIASLAKRLHVSSFKIFSLAIRGKLNEYVKERAEVIEKRSAENEALYQTVKKQFDEIQDPQSEQKAKEFVKTARKADNLAKGIMTTIGDVQVIAQGTSQSGLSIAKYKVTDKPLGEGGFGKVFAASLIEKQDQKVVLKFAKGEEAARDVRNEHNILSEIHSEGPVRGVQKKTLAVFDLRNQEGGVGYIAPRFDFSLDKVVFGNKTLDNPLNCMTDLVHGLKNLHERNIVHGDIKPENTCSDDGVFALCDLGGARTKEGFNFTEPLGIGSDHYMSPSDVSRLSTLGLKYKLHLAAIGKYGNKHVREDVFRQGQKNKDIETKSKLSDYKLSKKELAALENEIMELSKKRDVYALGGALQDILSQSYNQEYYESKGIDFDKQIFPLLKRMTNKVAADRPSIDDVYNELSKLGLMNG